MNNAFGTDVSKTMDVIGKIANGAQPLLKNIKYVELANAIAHGLVHLTNNGYKIIKE